MKEMIKKALKLKKEILDRSISSKKQWDKGEKYKNLVDKQLTEYIKKNFNIEDKKIGGSVGAGNYSNVPWVAIFNPEISTTTQEGYYLVYLFHPEGKGVYLVLEQGWKAINKIYNKKAKENALVLSKEMLKYVEDNDYKKGRFYYSKNGDSTYDIAKGLPSGYALTSIVYKYYAFDELDNEELHRDLNNFIDIYDDLAKKVTREFYDSMLHGLNEKADEQKIKQIREKNKNTTLAMVDPPTTTKYSKKKKVSAKKVKDSEIEEANREQKLTGDIGEELAYKYFKQLIEDKVKDEEKKQEFYKLIDTSMGKNHGAGYDMEAFDPFDMKNPTKKYIEVKTTKSKDKTEPYYISLNELFSIYENPGDYLILRIYDIEGDQPQAFIVDPYKNHSEFKDVQDMISKVFDAEAIQYKIFRTYDE
ncbi:MrcB family domain-containing protein [Staphylococcus simulans]|uniref:MrcB family domain-containing protein n=1 Tax=Staphylococcus simulans TaxID=1286 RepID=UPI001319CEB7|nr:DUF3578 domain-containing protein [Staphylococcus simulans]